jgi:hypothetical protein
LRRLQSLSGVLSSLSPTSPLCALLSQALDTLRHELLEHFMLEDALYERALRAGSCSP